MSIWLDPTGKSNFGIGICDRCSRKFSLTELYSDPNTPGLKVCEDDIDQYDPYRLPARKTENITLRFVRPDVPLTDLQPGAVSPAFGLFGVRVAIGSVNPRITEDGSIRVMEDPYQLNEPLGP
jgi:hypothetical protein